jgi:hypothetical protein
MVGSIGLTMKTPKRCKPRFMTSQTLFELWKDVKTNKRKARNVINAILKHNGELTLKDFE